MSGQESLTDRIERLIAEEHALQRDEERDRSNASAHDEDRRRLREVEVELDRCWDLLRQRRARGEAGLDPDGAHARDAETVEHYLQ